MLKLTMAIAVMLTGLLPAGCSPPPEVRAARGSAHIFLSLLQRRQYKAAHSWLSPGARRALTAAAFTAYWQNEAKRGGRLLRFTPLGGGVTRHGAQPQVVLTYQLEWDKGRCAVQLPLVHRAQRWLLEGYALTWYE